MSDQVQPVTFYVPGTAGEPVELDVRHSGLRMVLVNREAVHRLGDEWGVLGVYFLLGPAEDPERFQAYVGEVGKRSLRGRIREHAKEKAWWNRALLIASSSNDFNSAEIGWLEGRLYDVLNNAVAAEVKNGNRPGDDSISDRDRGVLERYIEPVTAALRACGAPPDTADQKPEPRGRKRPARYPESVKDLIDAGLLKPETRLHPLRQKLTETALVLSDGNLQVRGKVFASVSAAAIEVSGNTAEPGWEFWGAPSGDGGFVRLFDLRARLREDKAVAPTPEAEPPMPARAVPSATQAVAGAGVATSTSPAGRTRAVYSETLADLMLAGLIEPGEELEARRSRVTTKAVVLADGRVEFGGIPYKSLSGAAKAATGTTAEPGWEFWAVRRGGELVTLFTLRERLRAGSKHEPKATS